MFMSVLTMLPIHASGYTEHAARIENQVRYPAPAPDSLDALVSGWLYQYQSVQNGHPYFGDQNWVKSTVSTKYESFRNVLVKYDIYQDALIMPLYRKDGTFPVVLNSQEVMSFTLNAYTFINLDNLIRRLRPYLHRVLRADFRWQAKISRQMAKTDDRCG